MTGLASSSTVMAAGFVSWAGFVSSATAVPEQRTVNHAVQSNAGMNFNALSP
jgi:hypothetical protein